MYTHKKKNSSSWFKESIDKETFKKHNLQLDLSCELFVEPADNIFFYNS